MANLSSIGRPYALAAFDVAREKQQLSEWKSFLEAASITAQNPSVQRLLANPEIIASEIYALFEGVLASLLNQEQKNFLLLLAQNKRLMLLPEILASYNAYCAALEKISNVRVITAVAMDEAYKQKLTAALAKRIQRDVTLHPEIDASILGGAIIHIGDRVIDGSIRGKLTRLLEFSLR